MDKLEQYRQYIQAFLTKHGKYKSRCSEEIETITKSINALTESINAIVKSEFFRQSPVAIAEIIIALV